jgi:release factor glutamine methyltransferase
VPTPAGGDGPAGSDGPTWRTALAAAAERLRRAGTADATLEARRLVEHASGYDGAELVLALDEAVPQLGGRVLAQLVDRRAAGEPLQYVLGRWGFRTLDLFVDRRVLIPRPETEVVVGCALDEIDRLHARMVVDLGTGSGAIALSIAAERGRVEVVATDVSTDALEVARANLAGLGRHGARVKLAAGEWFEALPADLRGDVDVIVSNPPYIGAGETLPADVAAWEPAGALVAGATGLEAITGIVAEAPAWLARPGALVVEVAPHQREQALAAATAAGFTSAGVRTDLAGRDRVLVARIG